MAASATQTSNAADLVTAQFPLISNAVTSSKFDLSESKMPYVTAAGTPATYVESNDGAFESADLLFETAIAAILNMGDVLPAASTQGATQGITQAKVVARENSADTVLPTTLNRQLGVANAPVSAISKLNRTKSGNEVSTIQNPGVSEFIPLKEGIVTIPDNEVIDFAIQESEVGDSNTRGAGLSEGVSAQTNSEEEVAKQTGEVTSVDEIPGFY